MEVRANFEQTIANKAIEQRSKQTFVKAKSVKCHQVSISETFDQKCNESNDQILIHPRIKLRSKKL